MAGVTQDAAVWACAAVWCSSLAHPQFVPRWWLWSGSNRFVPCFAVTRCCVAARHRGRGDLLIIDIDAYYTSHDAGRLLPGEVQGEGVRAAVLSIHDHADIEGAHLVRD